MSDDRSGPTDGERRAFQLGVFACAFAVALGGLAGLVVREVFHVIF